MTPTNQFPRDYDGIKRQNADERLKTERIMQDEIERQRARADKAEAACAEMRCHLEDTMRHFECQCIYAHGEKCWCCEKRQFLKSTDAGKGFLPPEKARELEARNKRLVEALKVIGDYYGGAGYIGALARQAIDENKETPTEVLNTKPTEKPKA